MVNTCSGSRFLPIGSRYFPFASRLRPGTSQAGSGAAMNISQPSRFVPLNKGRHESFAYATTAVANRPKLTRDAGILIKGKAVGEFAAEAREAMNYEAPPRRQ